MSEDTLPLPFEGVEITPIAPDPLTIRLEDLPAYGSPEVEGMPLKTRLLIGGGVLLLVLVGVLIGLQPLFHRQRIRTALERQIAAGSITAARTTLDRFAAQYPAHPDLRRYEGLVALGEGNWNLAAEHLRAQTARHPEDVAANRALGYLYGLEAIYSAVPVTDPAHREALIDDWTLLFGYTIAGLDASASDVGLPSGDAQVALGRAQGAGDDSPATSAALAGARLLAAANPEALNAAMEQLLAVEGASLPSFQEYYANLNLSLLADAPVEPAIPAPPPIAVPGMEDLAGIPAPGAVPEGYGAGAGPISELGSEGADSAALLDAISGARGAGEQLPGAATPTPSEGTTMPGGAIPGAIANELKMPSGMGMPPRVRPYKVGTFQKVLGDGLEEQSYWVGVLNIDKMGSIQAREGEQTIVPNGDTRIQIRAITNDGRRVVLEEVGRAVYVWRKEPGSPWFWDTRDPENGKC